MRRLAYLFLLAIVPLSAGAQAYGRIDFSLQNAQGPAISGATINVLAQSACGVTASGQAQLYSSATGGAISQPLHTDGFGHASAYTLPGCVTIVYNSTSTGTLTYPDQTVFSGTGAYCTISDCVSLITPTQDLQSAITAAGANGQLQLSCGTFNVAAGLTISNSGVHLKGGGRDCSFVNFTSSTGLLVSGTNVQIEGVTFEGATNNYTVQVATTANGFNFHDSRITGAGSAGGASQNSAALVIVAPNQDIWVKDNEFTGDGVTGNTGYIVKTDGGAAGYVQRFHFLHNWMHDNISPDPVYAFDIANSELNDNTIDQGNICGGALCNNPAGNGVGYALQVYSEGYSLTVNSLTRVSGVVTAVLPVAFSATWPLNVGDQIMEETALAGTNHTDFNGVFTVTSISGDRKTITWNQTGIPDDTGAGLGPPYANGVLIPPLQNVTVARNKISNSAGACTYFQGLSNLVVADNTLTQCDLQSQAGGHPQSAIGLNGVWGGSIIGNGIDGVGLTHGIAAQNAYFVTIAGNSIGDIPLGMGINIFDSFHLSVNSNTVFNAVTGIGTSTGTAPNCFGCSFAGNTIRMMANSSGYGFGSADSQISVTGGSIHAPSTGASNSAIALGALTSHITVSGVTINCQPDFATAATATITYGIRSLTGSSLNTMRANTITGCNASSGAGINDQGNDDSINNNAITGGLFGILANGGNRQLIVGNSVWGNSSTINTSGSTGAVLLGNQTTQGGLPVYFTFDFTQGNYTFGADANATDLMNLTGSAGHQRLFGWLTSGVARWSCGADSAAESGSNAGSPFVCRAYDDSGTVIDAWLSVVRASGGAETHTRPMVLSSISGSTQCLHVNSAGLITGTGSDCGAGGAGVASINAVTGAFTFTGAGVSCTTTTCTFSGTGSGVTSVALTTPSWLTVAGSPITTSGTLAVTATGAQTANQFLATPNGSTGAVGLRAIVAADVPLLTSTQIPAQYKIKPCSVGMGDGVNAIPAGTYPIKFQCFNDYGVTYTITGVQCASDNSGTSTGNVADNSGNALLTGAITATPTWASGTQSATTTLANGAWANWSIVADGVTKQIQCRMKGTY